MEGTGGSGGHGRASRSTTPSEARVWSISRAAGPDGARNTSGAASNKLNRKLRLHRRCEGRKRARLRCRWVAAGPGRASRRRTQPHASDTAPPAWRAHEGQAAAPVGGGGAWPGFETTCRAKLAARTARGRAAAHRHTQQPGPAGHTKQCKNAARHSKRGRHQPTPCASALTHP